MAALTHLGHFPFCEKLTEDDAPSLDVVEANFPWLMTRAQLMAMFYQVKTWRFTSWVGSVDITARSFGEYTQTLPYERSYAMGKEREPYLIVLSFVNGQNVPPQEVGFFGTGSFTATIDQPKVNFGMFFAQQYYETAESALATGAFLLDQPFVAGTGANEGLFRPQFSCGGLSNLFSFYDDYGNIEGAEFEFAMHLLPFQNPTAVGSVTLTFSDSSFTKQLYMPYPYPVTDSDTAESAAWKNRASDAAIQWVTESSECTIEAVEYWPF